MHCSAAISNTKGGFTIEAIEIGEPGPDEVRVRLKAAGLCHTDYDSLAWDRPHIMGHEGSGIVEAVGTKVEGLSPGDPVILNWAIPCLECFQCQRGNQHICENNSPVIAGSVPGQPGHAHPEATRLNGVPIARSFNIGTLSEYTVVKAAALVKNPSSKLGFPAASIISCGVMTGFGSAVNAAQVEAGSSTVVLGTGGVGLNVIQGCKLSGASKIIAIDINDQRLDMAQQFGATHLIKADPTDAGLLRSAEQVKSLTDSRGADYAFECTAIPALGAAPLAMIRNAGIAVQVSGIEEEITIDMNLFEWDKVYINPLYGQCQPQRDFPKIIQHYEKGQLLLDELITRTYSLDRLQDAFDDMLAGRNAKGVIVFD